MKARALARQLQAQLTAAGVPDAGFEAELMVRTATGLTRAKYFSDPIVDPLLESKARCLTDRRSLREPAAYLSGEREFFGLPFRVTADVLIPRPETELLVDLGLSEARVSAAPLIVDVGTGSGAIAIALACNIAPDSDATIVATDLSAGALSVAELNRCTHDAPIQLVQGDLLEPFASADVVLANLPYIPTAEIEELEPEVSSWEPRLALDGGPAGLDLVERLTHDCGRRIRPQVLGLEVGAGTAGTVAEMARAEGATVKITHDLSGIARLVVARWQ